MARAFEGLGLDEDYVEVIINGQTFSTKKYAISTAFFSRSPSVFTAEICVGEPLRDAYKKIQPGMRFEVRIDSVLQMSGKLDSRMGKVDSNGSMLSVSGRDHLAKLHDARAERDQGFSQGSYLDIVEKVLTIVNVEGDLIATSDANDEARAAQMGKKTKVHKRQKATPTADAGLKDSPIHIKAGEQWWPWLTAMLSHAGLMLRAGSLGQLILCAPTPDQGPAYHIIFAPAIERGGKFATSGEQKHDTTGRPSKINVRCKGGGKGSGTKDIEGVAIDDEMVALGIERVITLKDYKGTTVQGATNYARRKIAEARRMGFGYTYSLVGHSWKADDGRGKAVWTPDSIVMMDDREHGYTGPLWIESVDLSRGSETVSRITCMRPDDVRFFGEEG